MALTINHQTNSVEPSSGDLSIGGSGNVSINNEAIVDGDVTIDNQNRLRFADVGVDKALIGLNQGKYLYMGSEGTNSDPRIRFDGEETQAAIVPTLPAGTTTSGASGYLNLGSSTAGFKDLYLAGGVYIGGLGAANYMDGFETGNWTPTLGGSSGYSRQDGIYTKVGDMVQAWFDIFITTIGTGSVNTISGLPFTAGSGCNSSGAVGFYSGLGVAATAVYLRVGTGNSTISNAVTTAASVSVTSSASIYTDNTRFVGSVTYQAA